MAHEYERGDKVMWWSDLDPDWSPAVFLRYDRDFPKRDAILVINIGTKKRPFKHPFRWPLRLMKPLVD
jgi:uncharacterized membrane protein